MAERKRCLPLKEAGHSNSPVTSQDNKRSKLRTPPRPSATVNTPRPKRSAFATPSTTAARRRHRLSTPITPAARRASHFATPIAAAGSVASRSAAVHAQHMPALGQLPNELSSARGKHPRESPITEAKLSRAFDLEQFRLTMSTYFSHRSKAVRRSERNFSDLRMPRLSQRQFDEAKPAMAAMSEEEKDRLFRSWSQQIFIGHSLLVYGIGSKFDLLEGFGNSKFCKDGAVSAIDAFNGISAEEVVRQTAKVYFEDENFKEATVDSMIERLAKDERKIYLLVHGVDSPCFRDREEQEILGRLADCPNVTMVASLSHINGGLMWDTEMRELFNWSMCAVHTCQHYFREAADKPLLLNPVKKDRESEVDAAAKALLVLKSLVGNAQQVFLLLAAQKFEPVRQSQPLAMGSSANIQRKSFGMVYPAGLTFDALYKRCKERFVVSDVSVLRAHLKEFADHELVRKQTDAEGKEVFTVRLEGEVLETVVHDLSN